MSLWCIPTWLREYRCSDAYIQLDDILTLGIRRARSSVRG